jgi:pSer/pThr/pTyr-binding forkhead associated (FHA) protein
VARFVDLVAIEGPDKGMRYTVEEGTYRVLARISDDKASTLQMTVDGDRSLDREQEQLVGTRTGKKRRGADIVLRDSSVSRTHALVVVEKTGASVVDLMSTNGVKVNGNMVKDTDLKPGDVIHIGKTKLKVEDG